MIMSFQLQEIRFEYLGYRIYVGWTSQKHFVNYLAENDKGLDIYMTDFEEYDIFTLRFYHKNSSFTDSTLALMKQCRNAHQFADQIYVRRQNQYKI